MKKLLRLTLYVVFLSPFAVQAQMPWNQSVPGTCSGNCVTPLDGNGTLGQIYNNSACGLNYVTFSNRIGQRFSPAGTGNPSNFNIAGIPPCADNSGSVLQAFLWAGTSGNGAPMTVSITNPVGTTQNFPMAVVGSGPDKCWGYAGTHTYRADVTSIITGNGNYTINGFLLGPGTNDVDGATLMIIYQDPTATYEGHIVIHDGTVVINGGSTTQNVTGINACANSTFATAFSCIADLQMAGTLTMNNTPAPFTFNWWNYTEVNTTVTNGQATAPFTMNTGGDCFNFAVAGLYYQTMTCTTCPTTSPTLTLNMSSTPASCSNCNGTATVTPSGLPGPYTYSWAPSGGTGATATGLCAGTYTVTVTANNGCVTATNTVTVTNAGGGVTVGGSQTNASCNGVCDGTATANPTTGTAPYSYNWAPSGGTGITATGLCAGTYTVTVTDANGCTGSNTYTITEPPVITANITASANVTCNGLTDGSATVTAGGGTPGYTYSWAPSGGTGPTATGLGAGNYVVTVTDASGCTETATVTITEPTVVTANISAYTDATCNGANDGTATVTAGGGTPGYTYSWAPSGGTNATATGLGVGTYTVTVTDANGCTETTTVTISEPAILSVNVTAYGNVDCWGASNGWANTSTAGGSGPINYLWTPGGGTVQNPTGMGPGNYTVTVTDANGCTATATVNIISPTDVTANITASTNVSCNGGNDGSATVTAGGGMPGYTYNWAPSGGTNATATGLAAGNYVVTVTDANGCTETATVTITEPAAVTANITATTDATCSQNNGSATVTAGGGNPGYTYTWAPSGGNTATANNIYAGTYTVTVTDMDGCTATATANILNLASPTANITAQTNVSCNGGTDGSATVTAAGGTPGYTYNWTPSGGTGATANNLGAGTYTVTVTDASGCTTTTSVTITEPTGMTVTASVTSNFNGEDVSCFGSTDGALTTNPSGGAPAYTYSWNTTPVQTTQNATNVGAGNYQVTVTDANGCTATATVTVTEPTQVTTGASVTSNFNGEDVSCFGSTDGALTTTPVGGTPGYTYAWNTAPVQNTQNATNVGAGNYQVTVTDANGCTATATVTVTEPVQLTTNASVTSNFNGADVSCFGSTDGTLTTAPAGGTPVYSYSWNTTPVQTTQNASNLGSGNYQVTVTDANGCTATATVTVTDPPQMTMTLTSADPDICQGDQTDVTSNMGGGMPGYTYAWSNGVPPNPNDMVNPMATTTYTLTVTDANGCVMIDSITISVDPLPVPVLNTNAPVCEGLDLNLMASGGDTYTWTGPGGFTSNYQNPTIGGSTIANSGTYQVIVTTANGCVDSATMNINIHPMPVVSFSADNLTGCAPVCANFSDLTTLSSGSISTWDWQANGSSFSNQQNPNNCFNNPGSYNITLTVVTDQGCTDNLTFNNYINVSPNPVAEFYTDNDVVSESDAVINFTDGSSSFVTTWNWDLGDGNTSNVQNPSHIYGDTGTFCITLNVYTPEGCTDQTQSCITVEPDYYCYIPNSFTPNDDKMNDIFRVYGRGIETILIEIYDRWGEKIYVTTDNNVGWPGYVRSSDTMAKQDVYIYKIYVTTFNKDDFTYSGHVNLIR